MIVVSSLEGARFLGLRRSRPGRRVDTVPFPSTSSSSFRLARLGLRVESGSSHTTSPATGGAFTLTGFFSGGRRRVLFLTSRALIHLRRRQIRTDRG